MISRKGNIKKDLAIMFNHGDIGEIVCRGYEDDERRFRSLFLNTGVMKKMYFLKDRKEAVIDRLTYMSKHRQEYLQDKEHGMITLQFKQGMPVIRFSSGRVTSYWDFSFDGKKMTVQRRCSLSDKIIWGTLLIIDLFILYLFRQSIWLGLAWFCALLLLEVLPFYALESCVTFRHVKMFVTHYLADYIGESEEIYEM